MATKVLEVDKELVGLREKREILKVRDAELRQEWLTAGDDRDGQKAKLEITSKIQANVTELVSLGPQIAEAKEARKVAALEHLLASQEYRKAVATAAKALAEQLEPWFPLLALTLGARKQGIAVPSLPASIGTLYVEGLTWLQTAIRRGTLDAKTLPLALRALLEGGE